MARAIWSGSISFGLVNIPVKLVTAVTDKEVRFHLLHAEDGARIRFQRVCPKDGSEVPNDQIVRGFEVAHGQYVTFTEGELEHAAPEASRAIAIEDFVEQAAIDPAYYEKPYYLVPDKNADKAYALLLAALEKAGKVGIARMVMHGKQHLVAVRAHGGVLMLETMHFADEVVPADAVAADVKGKVAQGVDPRQLKLAEQLIASLTADFDPAKYRNEHRDRVLELVDKKAAGEEIVLEPAAPPSARTSDLMAALEASLTKAQKRPARPPHPARSGKVRKARAAA